MQAPSTRIRIFLNPQLILSVHMHLVNPAYESATFLNLLSRVENFEYAMNPDIFLIRWRAKMEPSSLPWILYPRWQPRRMLCCQYSQRSPGYQDESRYVSVTCARANSIWIRIRVDVEIFESGKKRVTDSKVSGYEWTGPQNGLCKRWAVEFPRVAH